MTGRDLPVGVVTFLFTDIEDSTRLLRELGETSYSAALAEHRRILRDAFTANGGVEVDTQGDSFFVAFSSASGAAQAALAGQAALRGGPINVRMGIHTGRPLVGPEGYVGEDVHLAARIAAAGHGGQVLVSREARDAAGPGGEGLVDLGEHRVKGFTDPVWIFQADPGRHPPLRTISNTNLPRPASSFVGRRTELEELGHLLRNGTRLVTLTGPGGTGKTRLAIEAAAALVPNFKNGVFWVGLAAVPEAALVMQTVGETIGAKSALEEHIADRDMLLVLDNFEHVIGAAPQVARLLTSCARLRLVVTSRELLRVDGELEFAVPVLADAEGVDLFRDRSGLAPEAAMADLCRRLDNVPLAIELAAARTRIMSPSQILERLGQRLDLLKGGRDADARQQTLRATIAWSHDLLSAAEKGLFARLSVFRDGCTLEAAEEVADADMDSLQSLVDKSLIRRAGERFRMLEMIREFAAEQLAASGTSDDIFRRHAEFYVRLAEAAEHEITGPRQDVWWQRLTDEAENIRAALGWAIGGASPAIALRLSGLMWRYWWQRGYYQEGKGWYEAALAIGGAETQGLRARALRGLASMLLGGGDAEGAITILETCLGLFDRTDDYAETVATLTDLGIANTDIGALDQAQERFEEALLLTRAAHDVRRTGVLLINLGDLAAIRRDFEAAAEYAKSGFDAMVEAGDRQSAANAQANYGGVELQLGNLAHAAQLLAGALRASRQTEDRYVILHTVITAATLLARLGEDAVAARSLGCAEALEHEMGIAVNPTEQTMREATLADLQERHPHDLDRLLEEGRALGQGAGVDMVLIALDSLPGQAGPGQPESAVEGSGGSGGPVGSGGAS